MNETLHQAAQAYLEHLRTQGKKERTLYTYESVRGAALFRDLGKYG
jgi:hypothetical protein